MIDGIKFRIDPKKVLTCNVLEFHRKDENRQTAKYRGMIVELYLDSCFVRGSIHKYKNGGEHNADDFTLSDFTATLRDLSDSLNFNPDTTQFYTLEFGVNIELPFDGKTFIESVVCNNGAYSNNGSGITISFSEWEIKIYLKHNDKSSSILRYEIKVNKTRKIDSIIKSSGIFCSTLSDLANPAVWHLFGDELLTVFDSLLIVERDKIDTKSTSDKEIKLLIDGCTTGYWLKKWEYPHKRKRELEKFNELIQKHSTSTMKNDVRNLIAEKINFLIDIQNLSTFHHLGNTTDDKNLSTFHHLGNEKVESEKSEICPLFPTRITGENRTNVQLKNSLCEITGLQLLEGTKVSYLNDVGVKFYY